MSLPTISSIILQNLTGLPSKETFLKNHVVPARQDDKFNTNKCARCWDEYTAEHPAVRISPCGHVFGRDCLYDIVNGPAGDLCPYCRVKMFRRTPTAEQILEPLLMRLLQGIHAYLDVVTQATMKLHACIPVKKIHPRLRLPVILLFDGAASWAVDFVLNHTDIGARNPQVQVPLLYDGTTVLSQLLFIGLFFLAPPLLLVYYSLGFEQFKAALFLANLVVSFLFETIALGYHHALGNFNEGPGDFDNESDRMIAASIAIAAIAVQHLIILFLFWPVSTLGFAWSVLATVAWR